MPNIKLNNNLNEKHNEATVIFSQNKKVYKRERFISKCKYDLQGNKMKFSACNDTI